MTASREIDPQNTAKIIVYGNVFERSWYIQDQAANGTLLSISTTFLRKFNVFGVMPQRQFKFSPFGLDQQITDFARTGAGDRTGACADAPVGDGRGD